MDVYREQVVALLDHLTLDAAHLAAELSNDRLLTWSLLGLRRLLREIDRFLAGLER